MTNRALLAVSGLAIALTAISLPGQTEKPAVKRQKVVVMGASVSAGFEDPTSRQADGSVNRSFKLDRVLKKAWPRKLARIYNVANLMMFQVPLKAGQKQVDAAKRVDADLVIGIDFPFWFGYGFATAVAKDVVSKDRLAIQQKCFAMLDELECPILLGDYPDMRGASTKMLPRYMIPNSVTIAALNKQLYAYAAERKHVHVVSLARFVKRAVNQSQTYSYGEGKLVFPKNYLLQSDRLHATRLGVAVLTTHLLAAVPGILKPTNPLLGHRATLETLVKDLGLEDELPRARASAKAADKLPKGPKEKAR